MTMQKYRSALRNAAKALVATVMLAGLSACATAANPGMMAVTAPPPNAKAFPQRFVGAMCVRNVTGGETTNPLWVSKVDNAGFQSALTQSLQTAGLAAASPTCAFPVDANLLGLSQPAIGFDMTVTSHVNYKVYDAAGQSVVLATVDAPYTAKMSDAFMGVERLRLANEGSIRLSIQMFFDKLRDTTP